MDLRDLRYFELVADMGHLSKAAEVANRSQPAVTKCIQRLELELGTKLFVRSGRKLELTPVGQVLLARARLLRGSMEETTRQVQDVASGAVGHVRLGASATAADFVLPALTTELLKSFPGITLMVDVGMNDHLAGSLRRGELDLVVGPTTQPEPDLAFRQIVKDPVVVVANHAHPLFKLASVRLADQAAYRWVLATRSAATRTWLEQVFERQGLAKPSAQIESNSISLTPRLISHTTLLSFISRRNLGMNDLGSTVREVPLRETTMQRNFGVLCRADGYLSPAATSVKRVLERRGKGMFLAQAAG